MVPYILSSHMDFNLFLHLGSKLYYLKNNENPQG